MSALRILSFVSVAIEAQGKVVAGGIRKVVRQHNKGNTCVKNRQEGSATQDEMTINIHITPPVAPVV